MAVESMFTTFANVLAVFEITKALDAHGNEITPSGEFTNGSIRYALRFVLCLGTGILMKVV